MQTDLKRTHSCGQLRKTHLGQKVILNGWIHTIRDHGGVVFATVRDRSGIVQVVFKEEEARKTLASIRPEFVVAVQGVVEARPDAARNPDMPTGDIDIAVDTLTVLNPSEVVPIEVAIPDDELSGDNIRFRYRYLDLRRPSMQRNLEIRHRISQICRQYMDTQGFYEIETPFLTKSTPEGARDFVVPSRMTKGHFYALPQSPQLFKQLLMVSGFEKYFQIVRCFRDEDLRADRQPEFTQLDIEMSFIDEQDIRSLIDGLFARLFKEILGIDIALPIPCMGYEKAMTRWGSDRPDLRFGCELKPLNDLLADCEIPFIRTAAEAGALVGLSVPEQGKYARKQVDGFINDAKDLGAQGGVWFRLKNGALAGPGAKAFPGDKGQAVQDQLGLKEGDLVFVIAATSPKKAQRAAGELRGRLGRDLGLARAGEYAMTWVTDFPLFEEDDETGQWTAVHHPFTAPCDEDLEWLEKAPGRVKSRAYDIVINGAELGGGSIRIHTKAVQEKVFNAINLPPEEAQAKFSFLLEALQYGAPPHGGIALGLDRLVAMFAGVDSIREVIAFPKTHRGSCLLTNAPSELAQAQLDELGLIKKEAEKSESEEKS